MRQRFPAWIRKWAAGVLLALTVGSVGGFSAAVGWYGDRRVESTLNSTARDRLTVVEGDIKAHREVLGNLNIAIAKLTTAADNLNATLQDFATANRRENDLQWGAIQNLQGR